MGRPKGSKNKSSKLNSNSEVPKRKCLHCGTEKQDKEFYKSHGDSDIYLGNDNYLPICKDCIKVLFEKYRIQYENQLSVLDAELEENEIEKLAIRRLCMVFDIYYSDSLFESALRNHEKSPALDLLPAYMKMTNLKPNCKKSFDDTIMEEDLSQELIKGFMVDRVTAKFKNDGLYQDIYNLCLKLMESLKEKVSLE